jgi:outer membrane PBP1 activator LpoA protein
MEKYYLKVCFVFCIILLSACGTQTIRKDDQYFRDSELAKSYYQQKDYINAANSYTQLYNQYSEDQFALYAADSWLQIGSSLKAENYLSLVNNNRQALYRVIQAELNIAKGNYEFEIGNINGEYRSRFLKSKALLDQHNQNYLSAALSYIELSSLNEYIDYNNQIINSLSYVSETELNQALYNFEISELQQGWLEASIISLTADDEFAQQWKDRWEGHPAYLLFNQINNYKNIAVLLPLSGVYKNIAKSIQQGMIAAIYQNDRSQQQLTFYDTGSHGESFSNAWYSSIESGAELIIGPLEKNSISQLTQINSSSIPVLLLNQIDQENNPFGFYQFSLSQDDEILNVATRLIAENKKRIMLLAPESESGRTLSKAFEVELNYLGGQVVSYDFYPESTHDYSREIKQALGLNDSRLRARKLQSIISEKLINTPQIRPDIDAIFILAKPKQARLIKPQLKFYQASNVPVYSTSQIFSNSLSPAKDKDLDGIKFCQSHFIINPLSLQSDLNFDVSDINNKKYFAFGFDALSINPKLEWMQRMQNQSVQGLTGQLTVDGNGKIHRELGWAQFNRGIAEIIPSIKTPIESSIESSFNN